MTHLHIVLAVGCQESQQMSYTSEIKTIIWAYTLAFLKLL